MLDNCTNLKIFEMENEGWPIFDNIGNILQKNVKTLKEFKWVELVPSHFNDYRKPLNLLDFRQHFNKPFVFIRQPVDDDEDEEPSLFVSLMSEMRESNWLKFGLNLTKLDLSFATIALSNYPIDQILQSFEEIFLPFLHQQKQLKQLALGEIYSPHFNILQKLNEYVDPKCILYLQIVEAIQNEQNIIQLEGFVEQHEMYRAMYNCGRSHIYFDNNDILNHKDSTVQLNFYNPESQINISFVSWKVLDPIFIMNNLSNLTKLMIYQGGVALTKQIVITDTEMQLIILKGINLTHLFIEYCNMEQVTDFGLTGISAEASNRMLTNTDFTIGDGDRSGVSFLSLEGLMHLKLKPLGNQVTDVTANIGFKGMKMKSFCISTCNMTDSGKNVLRNGFANYNTIECRIY